MKTLQTRTVKTTMKTIFRISSLILLSFALLAAVLASPRASLAESGLSAAKTGPALAETHLFWTQAFQAEPLQTAMLLMYDQPRLESAQQQAGETKGEKKSDEESTDAFRHSPTVHWFANFLHMDDETTARIFEYINFAIVVLAVGIPLFKLLPNVLRKRKETLSHELQSARAATEGANSRLSAIEARFAGLDAEIDAIRKQVDEDMRHDEQRIKASIEEETARIVAAAEHEIGAAAMQAQRGLKQYAADLAIDRAMSQLTLTEATDSALIAEFASGSKSGGRGRKN